MNAKKNASPTPTPAPPPNPPSTPSEGGSYAGGSAGRRSPARPSRGDGSTEADTKKDGNSIFEALRRVPGTVWIALIVAILVAAFVLQNQAKMDFKLFWLDLSAPTWAVLAGLFAIGVLVGFLIRHRSNKNKRDKQK